MKTFRKHLLSNGSKIKQALERLDYLAKDAILFIVDDQNRLMGSLTDGDVRRGLLKGFTINNSVDKIIQENPKFIKKGDKNYQKIIDYRENNFKYIPVLNDSNQVVNVINFREVKSYLPIDAVIMAGGKGERLRPLTDYTPKPMLMVGDKPILEHNLDRLRLFGIDDIWLSTNYLGKQIGNYFGDGKEKNIEIQYVNEEKPLGTIGALSKIQNFKHDNILVTNSDVLTNVNYENFFLDFIEKKADFSILSIPYNVDVPYAILETINGEVLNLKEKPTYTYYSNGGIYLMNRETIKHIPKEKHFDATELISLLIQSGRKVITHPLTGYWLDIGRHEDYEKAQRDIGNIDFK
jgi:dTDP-glucose pyrophosphorylase